MVGGCPRGSTPSSMPGRVRPSPAAFDFYSTSSLVQLVTRVRQGNPQLKARIYKPIFAESELESALELTNSSTESADSNTEATVGM